MRGLGTLARFKWRPSLPFLVLVPLTIAAASVLSYYTWETASRFEELGASSIAHSTLLLVEEKVDRIEQQIISRDNAVFHLMDLDGLLDEVATLEPGTVGTENLRARWLPLAERVSPSVRAVLVFTPELEVIDYVARAAPNEQRAFLRLFRKDIAPEIDMSALSIGQLRHLHTTVAGTSYLISYVAHSHDGQTYLIAAHHDIGYIVREEFPRLFANEEARAYFNVVDEGLAPGLRRQPGQGVRLRRGLSLPHHALPLAPAGGAQGRTAARAAGARARDQQGCADRPCRSRS
jgi:two-component system phosphate regulon sensor histidine kinase PhoR